MRNRTVDIVCLFTIFLSLAGCNTTIPELPTQTSILSTETPTRIPDQILTPSVTNTIMSNTTLGIVTCPEITKSLPGVGNTSGKLVLFDHDKNNLAFFDLLSGKREPVIPEGERANSYAVSTNGKWLAYESQGISLETEHLIVITAQGDQVISLPWEKEWWKVAYWLDDQRLIIQLRPFGNSDLLVMNPFANKQQKISFHSPNIYSLEYPPNWRGTGPIIYSPSLKQAVFAGANNTYFLAEAESGHILASLQSISFLQFPTKAPMWSPDGTQVLISAPIESLDYMNDELFSVSQTGVITKLTGLMDIYSRVSINRYNWSPDGQYIALFLALSPTQYNGEQLALLNPSTRQFNAYCIQGDITEDYRKNLNGFYDDQIYTGAIWSPDSRQVLVENRINKSVSNVILLDIGKNIAFQIISDENVQPLGWMVSP